MLHLSGNYVSGLGWWTGTDCGATGIYVDGECYEISPKKSKYTEGHIACEGRPFHRPGVNQTAVADFMKENNIGDIWVGIGESPPSKHWYWFNTLVVNNGELPDVLTQKSHSNVPFSKFS